MRDAQDREDILWMLSEPLFGKFLESVFFDMLDDIPHQDSSKHLSAFVIDLHECWDDFMIWKAKR